MPRGLRARFRLDAMIRRASRRWLSSASSAIWSSRILADPFVRVLLLTLNDAGGRPGRRQNILERLERFHERRHVLFGRVVRAVIEFHISTHVIEARQQFLAHTSLRGGAMKSTRRDDKLLGRREAPRLMSRSVHPRIIGRMYSGFAFKESLDARNSRPISGDEPGENPQRKDRA
jgi:hypothetical protein